MQISDLDVTLLSDGTFRLDGGAMFGVVPKPLWERKKPADEANRIHLGLNCLLVRGRGRTVVIESGIGSRWSEKHTGIYDIRRPDGGLQGALQRHGVAAEQVTDVILTHLHFDHAGGAVVEEDGEMRPAFPNATYHVQADCWHWAHNPTPRDSGSFRLDDFDPLSQGDLELHEGAAVVLDGIRVDPTQGHTVGHQVVRIVTDEATILFPADVAPTTAHLKLPYVMAYDLFPLTTVKEKAEWLGRAADQEWIVVFGHETESPCVRLKREGDAFAVAETIALESSS